MVRKILLFVLFVLTLQVSAQVTITKVFDFTNPLGLTPPIDPSTSNGFIYLTDKTFKEGAVSLSFADGSTKEGAYLKADNNGSCLSLFRTTTMSFVCSGNAHLEEISFDDFSITGDLGIVAGQPGKFESEKWSCNGDNTIQQVVFRNNGSSSYLNKICITYTEPSEVLVPESDIANQQVLSSFSGINLTFEKNMVLVSDEGITLSDGTTTMPLSASVSGNKVTLSVQHPIAVDGNYTLTVPAKCFKDSEGYENVALSYKFSISVPKNTFTYTSVSPETGRVAVLNDKITLTFPSAVADFTVFTLTMQKDGIDCRALEVKKGTEDNIVEMQSAVSSDITEVGTYTIRIPEKSFYNALKGTSSERYNPEVVLEYVISSDPMPDTETMKKAKELFEVAGVGYPTATSTARANLKSAIEAVPVSSDDDLQKAIDDFYAETAVDLPEVGKYYQVVSVNADGNKLYLTNNDGKVTLTSDATAAEPFKVVNAGEGKTALQTTDGKYLHVLTAEDGKYTGTSSSNVTEEYSSDINDLTFAKLNVSGKSLESQFGLFSMSGSLGTDKVMGVTKSAPALIEHPDGTIRTNAEYSTVSFFWSDFTNAFSLVEVDEPKPEAEPIEIACVLTPTKIYSDTEVIYLTMQTEQAVTMSEDATLQFVDAQSNKTDVKAEQVEGEANKFAISLSGLTPGSYQLAIPTGAFVVNVDGEQVKMKATSLAFTIASYPEEDFVYGYSFYNYCGNNGSVESTYLNNIIIYNFEEMAADPTKTVQLVDWWDATKIMATGHFEQVTLEDIPGAYAWKIVLDEEIPSRGLKNGRYTFVLQAATVGDGNFGKYLSDKSSVRKSQCTVNSSMTLTYDVDNDNPTGIRQIELLNAGKKSGIYDLTGRKVNDLSRPGIYIVNGKKVVVK